MKAHFNRLHAVLALYIFFIISASNLFTGFLLIPLARSHLLIKLKMTAILMILITLGISTVIGAIVAAVVSRHVIKPIRSISKATRKIATGDFSVRVEKPNTLATQNDEISDLITSFNDMASELQSIELFRNDFINDFSHEFKTPIISIRGFARQLYLNDVTPEQQKEYSRIIMDEAEHLANMSTNILILSKIETQDIITDKTDICLDEQIREAILLFETQWSNKNIDVSLDLDCIHYCQSADLLSLVWKNLISNAVKFTETNGTLFVSCKKKENNIVVVIRDNGCGIDKETITHIFDKFYQGDTSHKTSGNGLGLALVKRIIDMMHGNISVRSTPGNGTTFIVTLPD